MIRIIASIKFSGYLSYYKHGSFNYSPIIKYSFFPFIINADIRISINSHNSFTLPLLGEKCSGKSAFHSNLNHEKWHGEGRESVK